ncbi:MAG: hypothetical protein A3A26_01705 [Candidatus Zambryskibacteria bacterium RIFCSPLOWO2_01_FULL_47_14]|uniref:Glycosyltransferase RgtA/B/C/D-like domain-containing protein n=2 Tax=Parcubacteria group TaxID=1794811 RepID=A0A1G2U7K4_9BACT|nr:MAG: Glycosyl transferase, family 39 [Parcubacteria group bacterium GW2011_GWA1_49_11]OGN06180.1 MAG: hypothetical protein A2669_02620 [Candidatus Yanofskybacteria bacterium RIFCSPHIGHO2_01_FULL_48_25b]OHB05453.1 MAG: hypothetical protein A3A26_01705 [Candidatus Zambryskibacteria bacterium RIFCSPLOWO2_01_FULL_47_14]
MKKHIALALVIIIAASITAAASAWRDSPIVDEVPHIGAAYSYVFDRTFKYNSEHPPLAKDLAGLALLPLGIDPAASGKNIESQWDFGRYLIYHSGVEPSLIIHAAKLAMIPLFIIAGLIIFVWTKKIYGPRVAVLAVFLFSFCPTIIAHSRFVTTDIAALFGVLFSTYFFLNYLEIRNPKNFWLAAVSFGIALLTKFSTFLLAPYFLILAIIWAWAAKTRTPLVITRGVLVMVLGFIVIVGPIYQIHILNYSPAEQKTNTENLLKSYPLPVFSDLLIWSADKPLLRPYAQYSLGLTMVLQRAEGGNRTYFLGKLSNTSFRSYFPVVFLLKEPIPLLILIGLSLWFGLGRWFRKSQSLKNKIADHFPQFAMMLWIVIYAAASISGNLNIGIRHLIPIYGFMFILIAGQVESILYKVSSIWYKNHSAPSTKLLSPNPHFLTPISYLLILLLVWYFLESVFVYPYYLAYFNQFAGGPSGGHRYVVDSNLDWGQDLWRLADFVRDNKIQNISLDYFGWAEQSYYLGSKFKWVTSGQYPSKEQFLKDNPGGGWLAVSATYFQQDVAGPNKYYAWLDVVPRDSVGHSIFVWHVTR